MFKLTYAGKLGAALGLMVLLTATVGIFAVYSLQTTVRSKDAVIEIDAENVALTERLGRLVQQQRAIVRDYLLANNAAFLAELQQARRDADDVLRQLEQHGVAEVRVLREGDRSYTAQVDQLLQARRDGGTAATGAAALEQAVGARVLVEQSVADLLVQQQRRLNEHRQEATDIARNAKNYIIGGIVLALIAGLVAAWSLRRTLVTQIGSAVEHVQSSSAELQAAANQQASGSKEQATAMTEITTTMTELLATSRQIAESAQRVARVAEETASAGRSGDRTVQEGGESIASIKRQVDAIVSHMLDLGRRSQEIGGVLDIITELAEQTNILAVNAAIEAAGAGESGRRFGVVAEEIRKLADRVGGSAKEIRVLIQEVRAAVNASVMTTETAAKTVDAGAERFGHVSSAFREIAGLVRTTNEAAREIELSTKQQSSAVEQVNRGIADVAQAAKETEVTSIQMLKTVSELANLSLDLSLLIRAEPLA